MLKRFLIALSVLTAILVVVGLTLPWWLGGVLRWQGGKYDVSFAEYEAVGYGRWAVTDLRVEQPGWQLQVGRIEAAHPWLLWRERQDTELRADRVRLELLPTPGASEDREASFGPRDLYDLLTMLVQEMPRVEIDAIEIVGLGESALTTSRLTWQDQRFAVAELTYDRWVGDISIDPVTGESDRLVVVANGPDGEWRLAAQAAIGSLDFALDGQWRDQPIAGGLLMSDDSWRPTQIELSLDGWALPGSTVGLGEGFQTIRGETSVRWDGEGFDLEARWMGEPQPDSKYREIQLVAVARGNEIATQFEDLQIIIPGLTFVLAEPWRIAHDAMAEATQAKFQLDGDLAEFPWVEGSGRVTGGIDVVAQWLAWPQINFDLETRNVSWRHLEDLSGGIRGEALWPSWGIDSAEFQDEAGNRISLRGEGEETAITEAKWSGQFQGDFLSQWIAAPLNFESVSGDGTARGAWPDLSHEGRAEATSLALPGMKSMDVGVDWKGTGLDFQGSLQARAGESDLTADFDWSENQAVVQGKLHHAEMLIWELVKPAVVETAETVSLSDLHLMGPHAEFQSAKLTADKGSATFQLTDPSWVWLSDWLESPPTLPLIRSTEGDVQWEDELLWGRLSFDGEISRGENQSVDLKFAALASEDGLELAAGEMGWEDEPVAHITGGVPIRLSPKAPFWSLDPDGAIAAALTLEESTGVWEAISGLTNIRVQNPRLAVELAGTWSQPRGQGSLSVDQIIFQTDEDDEFVWPVVSDVEAKLIDDGTGLVVDPLTAKIDGQIITLKGEVPFTPGEWAKLSADPLAYFRDEGRGQLEIPRAELAAFAKFLPAYLVPTGELEVTLNYSPGSGTDGRIQLRDAVSKPLGPLGVLQGVSADLRFENRTMEIESLGALMGGQPLAISGSAGWPEDGEVEVDLTLQGENLPLVRKTGILLRSDLDLRINSDASGAGRVSGEARLRDGLVLVDVRSLVPRGGGASVAVPARRPPYFSVTIPPINQWDLQVSLRGEDFLRLRTPIMTGSGSLRARLAGTLESPLLLGELEMRDADLRLPFARLEVDEALVRLTEADPYDPEIWLEATGQRLGYDLRLEVEGRASEPQLTLQSSPSLTAEQVLMLVMAGVTPTDESDLLNSDRALRLGMYFGQGLLGDLFGTDERESLSVSTGEKLSRLGKETYQFEYEIADRWAVVGEYDEFDYYNAALKWRVRPGKPKDPEPLPPPDKTDEEVDRE